MSENNENQTTAETQSPEKIGEMTEEERQTTMQLQAESQRVLGNIGLLEVQKQRLMGSLNDLDGRLVSVRTQITERLKLEPGQNWVADQGGHIYKTPAATEGQ